MQKLGEKLWIFDTPFKLFGADFGNRMTVAQLPNNSLFVHSPVALNLKIYAELSTLGSISTIVTPNCFHGLFIDDWLDAFPNAEYFAPANVKAPTRAAPNLINEKSLARWAPDIKAIRVEGIPKLSEYAFFHEPSKSLILTDLAFNIGTHVSLWSKLFFSLNGAYRKFGPSRLLRSMIEDHVALKDSLSEILAWDFQHIVVSHGQVVSEQATHVFEHGFEACFDNALETRAKTRIDAPAR